MSPGGFFYEYGFWVAGGLFLLIFLYFVYEERRRMKAAEPPIQRPESPRKEFPPLSVEEATRMTEAVSAAEKRRFSVIQWYPPTEYLTPEHVPFAAARSCPRCRSRIVGNCGAVDPSQVTAVVRDRMISDAIDRSMISHLVDGCRDRLEPEPPVFGW